MNLLHNHQAGAYPTIDSLQALEHSHSAQVATLTILLSGFQRPESGQVLSDLAVGAESLEIHLHMICWLWVWLA